MCSWVATMKIGNIASCVCHFNVACYCVNFQYVHMFSANNQLPGWFQYTRKFCNTMIAAEHSNFFIVCMCILKAHWSKTHIKDYAEWLVCLPRRSASSGMVFYSSVSVWALHCRLDSSLCRWSLCIPQRQCLKTCWCAMSKIFSVSCKWTAWELVAVFQALLFFSCACLCRNSVLLSSMMCCCTVHRFSRFQSILIVHI